jgi:BirA family transcriptional regulator, biotin operon repressor / biotin---[acetyl-CoA-carboxylase] ligase
LDNISPKTLFLGQRIIYFPLCESTSSAAQQLLYKNEATEGTVVVTGHQTLGRGQRGNSWEAEPGQNITLSFILSPRFLDLNQQFYLNMAISLGVLYFGRLYLSGRLTLKWPNDLFYEDKKWGGILIENSVQGIRLQHSVVGIGINVNQTHFFSPKAVSFTQITGQQYQLPALIACLLEQIEKQYLALRYRHLSQIRLKYLQNLYRYQELAHYQIDGQEAVGQILGVDEEGRLAVQVNETIRHFKLKEIEFLP